MNNVDVAVIGSLNYDFFLKVNRSPKPGETMHANELQFSCGGKGANQAFQMGRLGLNVLMVGAVGKDVYGEKSMASLESAGVDVSCVKQVDSNTGMGFVTVQQDGEVSAVIEKGANQFVTVDVINEAYDRIFQSQFIVLQMEIPLETIYYVIQEASKHQVKVILNPAPSLPISDELLGLVDYLIVNEVEAAYYLGEDKSEEALLNDVFTLRNKVKHGLVLTYGSKGSYYIDNDITMIPIYKVNAVDTTCAGDSYIGAFVYGLCKGYSPIKACQFGAYTSAKTVETFGRNSMPNHLE